MSANLIASHPVYRNRAGRMRAARGALAMLRPPPDLLPSQWAEDNVRIPTGNARPGPYRIENAPYQREPMDMLTDPECRRITLMWGAQVGKTLTLLCMQGYSIAMRPRSQMMMQPSQGDVQTWLETKFNPLVESSPAIARRIAKPRGREGVNNQKMKSYPGGFLMLAWAGSSKTMRGRSAPFIGCDEVDGYPRTAEGHPVEAVVAARRDLRRRPLPRRNLDADHQGRELHRGRIRGRRPAPLPHRLPALRCVADHAVVECDLDRAGIDGHR